MGQLVTTDRGGDGRQIHGFYQYDLVSSDRLADQ